MKQVEVRIMGQNYILGCAEGAEKELLEAVKMVDKEMCEIRDGGKLKARERIAVLAALNVALFAVQKKTDPILEKTLFSLPPSSEQEKAQYEDIIYRIDRVLAVDGQLL
ncbi:MAG: cell division protein ZapA [Saezia sp.]